MRAEVAVADAFILGMLADDAELCVSALKLRGQLDRALRVDDIPLRVWQCVGPKYMYALAGAGYSTGQGLGWTGISDGFRRHLGEAEKSVDTK